MNRHVPRLAMTLLVLAAAAAQAQAPRPPVAASVIHSPHNLSTTGPGAYRSLTVSQVCVFCHAPHSRVPNAPLWNRLDSGQTYIQYSSSTLSAVPGQPEGSSRLCLACHDGTVALESMALLPEAAMAGRSDRRLGGRSNLGTDLADDHPISFAYDSALYVENGQLVHPAGVRLPMEDGMLRCGTCHDPHDNTLQPFLRLSSDAGELCTACHELAGDQWSWLTSSHATSPAMPRGQTPWEERKPQWRGRTVAENACFNCHAPHNAETPVRLMSGEEERTCYRCHDGRVAETDIQSEFQKPSRHPVDITPNPDHDVARVEDPIRTRLHVECGDCHNAHAAREDSPMVTVASGGNIVAANGARAPEVNGLIEGVPGLSVDGASVETAEFQYELCFRCHGQPGRSACENGRCSTARAMKHTRVDGVYNLRDKVDPTSNPSLVSYHPIVRNNPFNNSEVKSLRADLGLNATDTLIYCTDCHNGDGSSAGSGGGAEGPHGSIWPPLLAERYTLNPQFSGLGAASSEAALCFRCHEESRLRNDFTGDGFAHETHEPYGSCITCHDPHGSTRFKHLLNFETNNNLVSFGLDSRVTGAGEYPEPTWQESSSGGACWLNCHGQVEHVGEPYPTNSTAIAPRQMERNR